MSIYLLSVEPEGYKELTLPEGLSFLQCNCLKWAGESKLESWSTPELVWVNDDFSESSDNDADFIKFSGAIVISSHACQKLQPFLKDQVEFLPVIVDGETRYILNILNVLDILDRERSIFKIYSDGKIGGCEHAFINEPSEDHFIYKVAGFLGRIFISNSFVALVREFGLTGALIREYQNP